MLRTLQKFGDEQAERLLASFAGSVMPTPDQQASSFPDEPLANRLLEELRDRGKVPARANPNEARGRMFSVLAEELTRYALRSTTLAEVKSRLGARGELPPAAYVIEFPKSFKDVTKAGIRRSHIERAIRQPTAVEHLFPPQELGKDVDAFSLFVKTIGNALAPNTFSLLVISLRRAAVLQVLTAWRVYHSDVPSIDRASPLDLLKAFVEAFGVNLSVGGAPQTKFVLYQRIQLAKNNIGTNIITIQHSNQDSIVSNHLLRINSAGYAEVAIAYTINLSKYGMSLRRHGVLEIE